MRRTDLLIVGGGPAGSSAAIALARGGARPLLIERHAQPQDVLCGGFLSWRTLEALARLGIDLDALGGEPIGEVALYVGKRRTRKRLPQPGRGVSRGRLDAALLARAAAEGAAIERGIAARAAEGDAIRLSDGSACRPQALFLATGKHDLRGLARPKAAGGRSTAMGLRFRYEASDRLRQALAGTIELHLFRGGYAGLLLQEDGSANLCMAIRRSRLGEEAHDPELLLERLLAEAPRLGERLGGELRRGETDAIGVVPYGWRATHGAEGVFRLGDQAAVIASLAGEGVGVALASGASAARSYLTGGPGATDAYQRAFAARTRRPVALAQRLKAIAERPWSAHVALTLAPPLIRPLARLTRIAPGD